MKTSKFLLALMYAGALALSVTAILSSSGCAADGTLTPTAQSDAAKVQTALGTVSHVLQQFNTGLQTAAPSVDALLAITHNQGDALYVNNIVAETTAATPALTTLLANVTTAIKASTTPAGQIAAVNAATSPAAISAIVAPIAAAQSTSYNCPKWKNYRGGSVALTAALSGETRLNIESSERRIAPILAASDFIQTSVGLRPRYGWALADNVY